MRAPQLPPFLSRPAVHNPQNPQKTPRTGIITLKSPQQKSRPAEAVAAGCDSNGSGTNTNDDVAAAAASLDGSGPSPPPPPEAGLFSRLLRRGKAVNISSKQFRRRSAPAATGRAIWPGSRTEKRKAQDGLQNPSAVVEEDEVTLAQPLLQNAATVAPPDPLPAAALGPAPQTAAPAPDSQTSPSVKRMPSLRDRFRRRATTVPSPNEAQDGPRTFYVPTHAASDFSRMALSTRYRDGPTFDDDQTLVARFQQLGPITAEAEEDSVIM